MHWIALLHRGISNYHNTTLRATQDREIRQSCECASQNCCWDDEDFVDISETGGCCSIARGSSASSSARELARTGGDWDLIMVNVRQRRGAGR